MSGPYELDLSGRVAIVTGSSRGLGRAIALGYAAAGAKVVVTSRTQAASEAVAKEIEAAGGEALALAVDMGVMDDVDTIVDATVARFGRIDVVVNNAADPTLTRVEDLDIATYDHVHAVNAKGPLFLAQRALPHLVASGRGSLINVISVGVWNGGPMMILYRTSKAALWGATMVLAKEWGPKGVRVNALAPGTFETDMIDWMDDETRARAIGFTPLGRIADPTELVPAALYLASDASSFTTGAVLRVDGGLLSS
jgi:NAD(P)-dependent dehydrogenase (short-subunit alcohol dehydrogenase family)